MAVEWKEIYREGGTDVAVADGGTGASTLADGGIVIGNGTSAVEVVTPGATTEILVGGGAATKPVWTTATGTGAPVRATSPTLVTPNIGAASGTSLTLSGLTASLPVFTDGSKNLVSNTMTGTGKVVMDTSPTLVTPTFAIGSDADGDMYYRASSKLARLEKGTAYKHLGMNSGATAPEWQASANSVLTAAGDILYASSANTLARLAKGAANTKLFMNAAGTAPEWSNGLKVGSLTRDLSLDTGNVDYTGVGFKPSVMLLLSVTGFGLCIGLDDGATHVSIEYSASSVPWIHHGTLTILIRAATPDSNAQSAVVKTMNADGFTLTWTKIGNPTGTGYVYYLACR